MLFYGEVHSYFRELACQETPGTIMIQQVCLQGFKEETFKDHLACWKWVLRIHRIIKCKRNSSISPSVTLFPSLPPQMHSRFPKKPGSLPSLLRIVSEWVWRPLSLSLWSLNLHFTREEVTELSWGYSSILEVAELCQSAWMEYFPRSLWGSMR